MCVRSTWVLILIGKKVLGIHQPDKLDNSLQSYVTIRIHLLELNPLSLHTENE